MVSTFKFSVNLLIFNVFILVLPFLFLFSLLVYNTFIMNERLEKCFENKLNQLVDMQ